MPNEDLVIAALDAEKAFDQVEWNYLFGVLHKLKLGEHFIKWTQLLYKSPKARILTNQTISPEFTLHRGTRQGCPLSPLLFALAIEPLAHNIRNESLIYGYDTDGTSNRISLYADDILLYIKKPEVSIPRILEMIASFGNLSGYRINWTKSELMPVRLHNPHILNSFPFKVASEKFTYLGIQVTRRYKDLFKENFPPFISRLESCLRY